MAQRMNGRNQEQKHKFRISKALPETTELDCFAILPQSLD
jgi:hypothetical protein